MKKLILTIAVILSVVAVSMAQKYAFVDSDYVLENIPEYQDALDILNCTRKRAAPMIAKILKTAVADADEQQADVDNLYVSCARVDDAGIRIGTKRWIPKDRGRAHPIGKKACHIHVTVTEA